MAASSRQYDIVLYGATGYTGKYTAEAIAQLLPTNLRWAVAGRSFNKLQSLVDELKASHPDRVLPGIETSSLDLQDLKTLARRTKVLINAVGPYVFYGKSVVQACAEEGTHYVDTTGETPWVKQIIEKFQATAKKSGAVLVPQAGFESAVPDLLAYAVIAHIRKTRSVGAESVTSVIWKINGAASGGTLATVMTMFTAYPLKELKEAMKPYSLSQISPQTQKSPPILQRILNSLLGVRTIPGLGLATTSITGSTNAAIVNRSWSQRPELYGRNFKYEELLSVRNRLIGIAAHWAFAIGAIALSIPPIRWLVQRLIYQPGEGPEKEKTLKDFVEMRSVGIPENGDRNDLVKARLYFNGSMYWLTGLMMAEVARGLVDGKVEGFQGGGFTTAAAQGDDIVERMRKAGVTIDVEG